MLESTVIEQTMLPAFSQRNEAARDQASPSLHAQLRLLKEAALNLLDQIEPLGKEQPANNNGTTPSLYEEVRDLEIRLIRNALSQTHGHQRKAARLLGVKATTLNAKIKRYHIPFLRGSARIEPELRLENEANG